jgi:hypothetical protein
MPETWTMTVHAVGPERLGVHTTGAWRIVALGLTLTSPALAGPPTRCLTYEGPSRGQLQTLCDDGTRAVSTWNRTLERWESTVMPPPGQTCTGQLNPKTHQWKGRCR